jgi:hypothetical protein
LEAALIAGSDTNGKLTRAELALVPYPLSTLTHQVVPHIEIVQSLEEQLGFRHIAIASEEYAVTKDGKNFFGVMTLDQGIEGAQFTLGVRNSHSKAFRLSIVVGLRIFVCSNLSFAGDFNIVLAKRSKNFSLKNSLAIGIDEAQRGFLRGKCGKTGRNRRTMNFARARSTVCKTPSRRALNCSTPYRSTNQPPILGGSSKR